ncbi:MAG TPA: hypothetical protein PK228_22395, partial [Saprospiraceae bacterium]|nr:hypothetical protein [Saprospiraceae bacterium]
KTNLVLKEDGRLPDELLEKLFALRLEAAAAIRSDKDFFDKTENKLVKEVAVKYEVVGKTAKLANAMSNVLKVYGEILSALQLKIVHPQSGLSIFDYNQKPTLRDIRGLSLLQPSPEIERYLEWISASLAFEYYLVAGDLVLSKKILLSLDETNLLAQQLRLAFEIFAAHSTLSGLWKPKEEDERQLIRNIKIVTAIFRTERGTGVIYTAENMSDIIFRD